MSKRTMGAMVIITPLIVFGVVLLLGILFHFSIYLGILIAAFSAVYSFITSLKWSNKRLSRHDLIHKIDEIKKRRGNEKD